MVKKVLLILCLAMIWVLGTAQIKNTQFFDYKSKNAFKIADSYQILIDKNGRVYDWGMFGHVCAGCPCFYTKVMRTTYPTTDGIYTYYVYFYSNSYNAYGYLAGTYLKGVEISKSNILGGMSNVLFLEYFLINPKTAYFDGINLVASFNSLCSDDVVIVSWQNSVVY